MHLTIEDNHWFFADDSDRPEGAIRTFNQIRFNDWENGPYLWAVNQSGDISKYRLLENFHYSRMVFSDGRLHAPYLPVMRESESFNIDPFFTCFFLEQKGVSLTDEPLKQTTEFQAFFNRVDAEAYSEYLKSNEDYQLAVAAWHERFSHSD